MWSFEIFVFNIVYVVDAQYFYRLLPFKIMMIKQMASCELKVVPLNMPKHYLNLEVIIFSSYRLG